MAPSKCTYLKYWPTSRLHRNRGPHAIRELHRLLNRDVVFIAIDVEGPNMVGKSKIYQLGVSILDMRDVALQSKALVSSRQFCTIRSWVFGTSHHFHFGTSEYARNRDTIAQLRTMFYIDDVRYMESLGSSPSLDAVPVNKRYREVVLVGHGMEGDLAMLCELGFDIQTTLPIISVLDTKSVAAPMLGYGVNRGPSLINLLQDLHLPTGKMHQAGNDARFTMNALLALALKSDWDGPASTKEKFQRTAYAPLQIAEVLQRGGRPLGPIDLETMLILDARKKRQEQDWSDMLENGSPMNRQ